VFQHAFIEDICNPRMVGSDVAQKHLKFSLLDAVSRWVGGGKATFVLDQKISWGCDPHASLWKKQVHALVEEPQK